MDFDWKKTLPFIGALATGGVPALVATAATAIGEALGTTVEPTPQGVEAAVRAATPEQLIALKSVDSNLKIRMRELDTEDKRIDSDNFKAQLADVMNARVHNANTYGILLLGYLINFTSYACLAGVLWGAFWLMGSSSELRIDPGIAAMLGGIIGAAVQWLMQNASQANSFFFGNSPGAIQATKDLSNATAAAVASSAKKA